MFSVVVEASLQGLPEEQVCISKLREGIELHGFCTGSQASFVCNFDNVLVKTRPVETSRQFSQPPFVGRPTVFVIQISIEGEKAADVVKVVDLVYKILKSCNILLRIV
ncbi:hypothetical protein QPL79_06410 [Ignisphaera sp. 4213-co]|uniref:Uncharacterized protein n=1 Tax=Ignisphaera cupida TaxID=3050454 RepID=A0ABD4Z7L2_9CREN|nr:hypothetical protein [Ignisphaera sp. 4213-co]MDK6028992.1 hypothetical protein [Ignisphaera sp. 4213-co]